MDWSTPKDNEGPRSQLKVPNKEPATEESGRGRTGGKERQELALVGKKNPIPCLKKGGAAAGLQFISVRYPEEGGQAASRKGPALQEGR